MEAVEESMGPHGVDAVAKRKRTKRQRVLLPAAAASSTSSAEFSGCTTEEEEDMANCLILLAQGGQKQEQVADEGGGGRGSGGGAEKFTSRRFAEAATTTNGKVGFYVYECKTCSRCFPSFQALGGHRASHKKPKMAAPARSAGDEKKAAADEDGPHLSMNSFAAPFTAPAKPRVHECSICGSEFSSGQALGGHMRRHRPSGTPEIAHDSKKERSLLSLDLNLPAPPEDGLGEFGKSPAAFNQPPLIFSAPALVDCHY